MSTNQLEIIKALIGEIESFTRDINPHYQDLLRIIEMQAEALQEYSKPEMYDIVSHPETPRKKHIVEYWSLETHWVGKLANETLTQVASMLGGSSG